MLPGFVLHHDFYVKWYMDVRKMVVLQCWYVWQ